jgi:hypothetical protein
MDKYYVNNIPQSTGEHEVHILGCSWFPSDADYLGEFSNCEDAIEEAKNHHDNVDGCYWCCNECHTR